MRTPIALAVGSVLALGTTLAAAQEQVRNTALTIYSTTQPGAVPPELYRPTPGQGAAYTGESVPGYAMVRQERTVEVQRGANRLNFTDVAAYIDPTTVTFESLTSPGSTRVVEQSFQFDLVSTTKLMERYIDQVITVDQLSGNTVTPITGRLLSTQGGLVLATDDGRIHSINAYQNVHFPTLPGGLMTRPTLIWDVTAERAGREDTRITYQTAGITWWADYNLVYTDGADANSGFLDVGAWVSILNRSGASYDDARIKLIAGDVNRATPAPLLRMRAMDAVRSAAAAEFQEQSLFEYHLYTLARTTSLPDDSTKQIELFPQVRQVPAKKELIYEGLPRGFGIFGSPYVERDFGVAMNTKVDVLLKFENRESVGLGIPLPSGRIRVSQTNPDDGTLEFIGEDVVDHTPKDETVSVRLGSAFDVVGERRQVAFTVDQNGRRMEETIEVEIRNHKTAPVDVLVRERLVRWSSSEVLEASQRYERPDASTLEFPVRVPSDGSAVVRYRVRYRW